MDRVRVSSKVFVCGSENVWCALNATFSAAKGITHGDVLVRLCRYALLLCWPHVYIVLLVIKVKMHCGFSYPYPHDIGCTASELQWRVGKLCKMGVEYRGLGLVVRSPAGHLVH